MKKQFIYSALFFLILGNSFAQQTPASKQSKDIAIVGATAHIGNGNVIDKSLIIIKEGKLHTVADLAVAKIDLIQEYFLLPLQALQADVNN